MTRIATLLLLLSFTVSAQGTIPVVPGAFGFGITTRAAYGGSAAPPVLRVQNLNPTGAGSLRAALEAPGPRIVIFETSGTIDLQEQNIDVLNPYLTIAGQTAPPPGITIRGGGINFWTHDVLVQHLRIRPGDGGPVLPPTADHDATYVYGPNAEKPHHIFYDHCSFSWTGGKLLIVASNHATDAQIGIWRSTFSEALYWAKNIEQGSRPQGQVGSLAVLIGHSPNTSIIQSLFAHNADRNPEIHEAAPTYLANNVVYDWGGDENGYPWATFFYVDNFLGEMLPTTATIVNNVYIAGPSAIAKNQPLYAIGYWTGWPGSRVHVSGNVFVGVREFDIRPEVSDPRVPAPPVSVSGFVPLVGTAVEAFVLANAGARPADRDAVDQRIANEVRTRTGRMISSQTQVGGWPTLSANVRTLVLPVNPHLVSPSGYTNLELWLHDYARQIESSTPVPPTPLLSSPSRIRVL